MYNWQLPKWPKFTYNISNETELAIHEYAIEAGKLLGQLSLVSSAIRNETIIDLMVSEAIRTSAIEGEHFDDEEVRSSIRNQLGIPGQKTIKDPRAQGIAKLMLHSKERFNEPLTSQVLFDWHALICGHDQDIRVGMWRSDTEPMQIISGHYGHEKVHFEAPPSNRVTQEMDRFIKWFNSTTDSGSLKGPVRSAIAHIYFESIHPFDDGNGRVGRAISEKALSQDLKNPVLFSLSSTICDHKKQYYDELGKASHTLDISDWIRYFVDTVCQAQLEAKSVVLFTIKKAKFFELHSSSLSERQEKILKKMLAEGIKGFTGGMSAKKYMIIGDCSKATATRELGELLSKGCLRKLPGQGRSTRYELNLPDIK